MSTCSRPPNSGGRIELRPRRGLRRLTVRGPARRPCDARCHLGATPTWVCRRGAQIRCPIPQRRNMTRGVYPGETHHFAFRARTNPRKTPTPVSNPRAWRPLSPGCRSPESSDRPQVRPNVPQDQTDRNQAVERTRLIYPGLA